MHVNIKQAIIIYKLQATSIKAYCNFQMCNVRGVADLWPCVSAACGATFAYFRNYGMSAMRPAAAGREEIRMV